MAFRFRREGQYVKNRVHLDRSGFKPFMSELKWEVFRWHYERHMGPIAVRALMSYQQGAEKALYLTSLKETGRVSVPSLLPPRRCFLASAVPLVLPAKRSSNPFCLLSANRTGFVYYNDNPCSLLQGPLKRAGQTLQRLANRKTGHLRPHGKLKVGGTDPTPPVFPKNL